MAFLTNPYRYNSQTTYNVDKYFDLDGVNDYFNRDLGLGSLITNNYPFVFSTYIKVPDISLSVIMGSWGSSGSRYYRLDAFKTGSNFSIKLRISNDGINATDYVETVGVFTIADLHLISLSADIVNKAYILVVDGVEQTWSTAFTTTSFGAAVGSPLLTFGRTITSSYYAHEILFVTLIDNVTASSLNLMGLWNNTTNKPVAIENFGTTSQVMDANTASYDINIWENLPARNYYSVNMAESALKTYP